MSKKQGSLKKEKDDILELDEDSDLPVHEKFTKEKKTMK